MRSASYNDIANIKFNLDPRQLEVLAIPNKNNVVLENLLSRKIKKTDNGVEIGSDKYVSESSLYFMRAKTLQSHSLLLNLSPDSYVPINPKSFVDYSLSKGDVLISKDSNIGEVVILDQNYPNFMISSAIYKLPLSENKYYVLGFLKSDVFRKQLDLKVSKGATIRHAGKKFLECTIPFPTQNNKEEVVDYVGKIVEAIVNKEIEIKNKYNKVIDLIDNEIKNNQRNTNKFLFKQPTLEEIEKSGRINAAYYSSDFKSREYLVKNYKHGFSNIYELGFKVSRGQNLQVSFIGKSMYSPIKKSNFYTLLLPRNFSVYGTILKEEYLGNSRKLKTLKAGDIIFGAEGFEKGRSTVIISDQDNTITNIHGITINHNNSDMKVSMFVKCFLDYLRKKGMIDFYAVGGNGGSLAMKYWKQIPIPNFPDKLQETIAHLFYSESNYPSDQRLNTFLDDDNLWNQKAGIYDIDKSMKMLKAKLAEIVQKITNNEIVNIDFKF